jgi:hypothetical protein
VSHLCARCAPTVSPGCVAAPLSPVALPLCDVRFRSNSNLAPASSYLGCHDVLADAAHMEGKGALQAPARALARPAAASERRRWGLGLKPVG